jgi:hypothetical protein
MTKYTLLTFFSALGCSLFGYVFLPFASAFYAMILIFENQAKRIVSYVLPLVIFVINFLLRGICSLEAVAYFAVGFIIYLCVKKNKSKGETAFWLSFLILICLAISAFLLTLEISSDLGYTSLSRFFGDTFSKYKEVFLNTVTALVHENSDGVQFFAYNLYEANMLLQELIVYIVPVSFLLSFVIAGITLKVFCRTVERNAEESCEIYAWHFGMSNLISYFFFALSVVAMLASSDGTVFFYVIFTLNTVFTAVFAYIGLKSLYIIISHKKSTAFAIVLIVLGFLLLSSFAFQSLSYFGAVINILTNKAALNKRNNT